MGTRPSIYHQNPASPLPSPPPDLSALFLPCYRPLTALQQLLNHLLPSPLLFLLGFLFLLLPLVPIPACSSLPVIRDPPNSSLGKASPVLRSLAFISASVQANLPIISVMPLLVALRCGVCSKCGL